MKIWDLNQELKDNKIFIIYGFGSKNIVVISEKELEKYETDDYIKFGIQILKIKKELKEFSIPSIDSTLNNITIPYYRELQDFFYNLGIRLFKIKFERNDAHIIENFTDSKDKFRDYMLKIMRKDVFYACDLHLNTVLITEINPKIDLVLHGEENHNRNVRNIFGKLFVEKLWYGYE